ncbi:hypothetical protein GUJ93_ZPchr0012g19545 [Zizania palustris]|uniref:Uncharacterized protein n=1 Tax=Zizania palustris TaxID=103762 RepID=A0A8J6BSZ2_ZIZPA|nr:hypothetical protein GUJ93_ZPchr0012g19545 [Zizania palustris]
MSREDYSAPLVTIESAPPPSRRSPARPWSVAMARILKSFEYHSHVALEIREQLDTKGVELSRKDDELRWLETETHGLREKLHDLHLLASSEHLDTVVGQAQRLVDDAATDWDAALAKIDEAKKQFTERDAASVELEKLKKQLTDSKASAQKWHGEYKSMNFF